MKKSFFHCITSARCEHDFKLRALLAVISLCIVVLVNVFMFKELWSLFNTKTIVVEAEAQEVNKEVVKAFRLSDAWNGTPLEDGAEVCQNSAAYFGVDPRMTAGISNAEYTMGLAKNYNTSCHNPWGWDKNKANPKGACWENWKQACDSWHLKVRAFYIDEGLNTPDKMKNKYVGWDSPVWSQNVKLWWNP